MKDPIVENTSSVCNRKYVGGGIRRGSEWWNEDVNKQVEEKNQAYEEGLSMEAGGGMKDTRQ